MDGVWLTRLILLVLVVGLAVYDIVIIRTCGNDASLSLVIYDFACRHPIASFALGVLVGHVFWPHVEG